MRTGIWHRLLAFIALAALSIPLAVVQPIAGDGDEDQYGILQKRELRYPNLGSHLDQLVASVEAGEASAEEAAEDTAIHQGRVGGGDHPPIRPCGRRGAVPGGQRRRPPQRWRGLYRSLRPGDAAGPGIGTARRNPGCGKSCRRSRSRPPSWLPGMALWRTARRSGTRPATVARASRWG